MPCRPSAPSRLRCQRATGDRSRRHVGEYLEPAPGRVVKHSDAPIKRPKRSIVRPSVMQPPQTSPGDLQDLHGDFNDPEQERGAADHESNVRTATRWLLFGKGGMRDAERSG